MLPIQVLFVNGSDIIGTTFCYLDVYLLYEDVPRIILPFKIISNKERGKTTPNNEIVNTASRIFFNILNEIIIIGTVGK